MLFSELTFNEDRNANKKQAIHFFENGYGVSVIRSPYSFGYEKGLWEVAILKVTGTKDGVLHWKITFDTPITDDVIGDCTPQKVEEIMEKVEKLPIK